MLYTEGVVFGGSEGLDESVFYFQMVARSNFGGGSVGLSHKLFHT